MLSEKMEKALNAQINKEFYSEYLYLSMAAWLEAQNLSGFANFFVKQAQEEHEHGMKIYRFVFERGGRVTVKGIGEPAADFSGVEDIFAKSLEHEKTVTASIHGLVALADELNDYASRSFLNWFVDEQVEEEASMEGLLAKLQMVKSAPQALLMLDARMGER